MRRLFRLAHGGDNFLLPNLKIYTEVVIDPQGGLVFRVTLHCLLRAFLSGC